MTPEIETAWKKAQAAWEAAGKQVPCYEPAYMAAREELAAAYARAEIDLARMLDRDNGELR